MNAFTLHGSISIWASGPWSWPGTKVNYVGSGREKENPTYDRGPAAKRNLKKGKLYKATIVKSIHDGDALVVLSVRDRKGKLEFVAGSLTVHDDRPAEGEWAWIK